MELPQTIEIKGSKVLTTKQIAEAYGVTTKTNIFLESIILRYLEKN